MAFDDPELVAEFITEAREHLADVESQLLAIEAGGADIDVDLVNTVFRGIHSVKGAAGFLGLTTVNRLAHSLENVLGKMRTRELVPTPPIVEVMLKAADTLTKLINDIDSSNSADVTPHTTLLDEIFRSEAGNFATPQATPKVDGQEAATDGTARPSIESSTTNAGEMSCAGAKPSAAAPSSAPAAALPAAPQREAKSASAPSAVTVESSIRVQVGVLDSLMNLAGELVLGRNQLMQTIASEGHAKIEAVAARLDQVTTELQEAIMRTRMQSIGAVFSKFPRVVRDLSAKLGKQCDVEMEGKEVEVDKTILEAIGDPLTHLVRNSIDHGVEKPEARTASGKPACGTVRLRAYHQAGKVRIDVGDDGGGINPAKLRQKAVEKGILSADQAARMGDREAVRLIFHPGFSTAEQVTDVSGRGVGMDVVRTNIEKLGGTVDVDSIPGQGTTIQITLPLTLAIIPSLIIRARNECFAVPQVNVLELVRIRNKESQANIARVKDAEVLRLRGQLLPLVRLDQIFGLAAEAEEAAIDGPVSVIVIETGLRRYGVVVDEIVDSEEIVVKPLGRHVKSCNCLAGATILGDGRVALILDAAGIAARAQFTDAEQRDQSLHGATGASESVGKDLQDLLLFNTSTDDRFAAPMSLVTRLERVAAENIKFIGDRRLLQYRGSSLPLLRLEDFIKSRPMAEAPYYFVIAFRAARREAGLLVPSLDDIRQLAPDIDSETFLERGVAGSFVQNGATMRLIDLVALAEQAYPEWFAESQQAKPAVGEEPLLLIAEDSAFFRKQVSDFLTSQGYRVVGCEDGAEAWEYLSRRDHDVKLVITDVEMPNVTGFELCRRIRQDVQLRALPVIALTSLTSDADVQRGREAGVDDYQVKMDRERVIEAVKRLLPCSKSSLLTVHTPAAREQNAPVLSA